MSKSLRSRPHTALIAVLAATRKEAELTQEELAQRLKKHRSYIAKIENGERRVDIAEFILIAKALNVDPERLFSRVVRW